MTPQANNPSANQPVNNQRIVPFGGLRIVDAFTFLLDQPGWFAQVMPLIAGGLVPGLNLLLWGGSALTIARSVASYDERTPIRWRHWTDILVRGLIPIGSYFFHAIPALFFLFILAVIGDRGTGVVQMIRATLSPLCYVYLGSLVFALNAAHVRSAQSDQFAPYSNLLARFGDVIRQPIAHLMIVGVQIIGALIGLMVAAVLYYAVVVAANAVLSIGLGTVILSLPVLGFVIFVFLAVVTLFYMAFGHLIGQLGR